MKAIIYPRYGSPQVLEFVDQEKPTPTENQILIKVVAASVNPLDWHKMRGAPFLVRLSDGLTKPKDSRLGVDVAGYVEAVGASVTNFQVGDEVYGTALGAFAEYVCANQDNIVHKPAALSFAEAASLPVAAVTALQALRNHGNLQAGQKVLVNGSSGGVGIFTVQLAKALGASEVSAVCSSRNADLVRSLGADHVIDYTKQDINKITHQFDLIIDNVGNLDLAMLKRTTPSTGTAIIVGFTTIAHMLKVLLGAKLLGTGGRKITSMLANETATDFQFLNELMTAGKLKPVIDKTYRFNEIPEAIRYLETGRARGKVVIDVAAKNEA